MASDATASAPGKLVLLGEHAVVYGRPCLVTALSQRITIRAKKLPESILWLESRDINLKDYKKPLANIKKGAIPREAGFVELAAANFLAKYPSAGGIKLESVSKFYPKFGLGSSSAAIVCAIKALAGLFNINLSQKEIFDLSYKTVLDIQGKGSGFDVAAAVYGGTLYFTARGKIIEPVAAGRLPLVIGYSGNKADTTAVIDLVAKKAKKFPKVVEDIYDNIAQIVDCAKAALQTRDWEKLGDLMNFNQGYLEALGVSTKKLSAMVHAAADAGAWGAKLSGAGGGDCMIAIAPEDKRQSVEKAIEDAGGTIVNAETGSQGTKLE